MSGFGVEQLPTDVEFVPGDRFAELPGRIPVLWKLGDQRQMSTPVFDGRVRYVGQPVGVVIGPDAAAVADAIDRIEVRVDPLPVVADVASALAPGAPTLHNDHESNVLTTFAVGDESDVVAAALAGCEETLSTTMHIGRIAGVPLEGRGVLVVHDRGRMTIHTSTQAPHAVRDTVAEVFGLSFDRVRVVAPQVGGGFGVKDHIHDDELFVVAASLLLDRDLLWLESRTESLLANTQARSETHEVTIGFDRDGRLRAMTVDAVRDAGAHFAIFGGGPLFTALGMMPGGYRWEAFRGEGRLVATNRVPTAAYRGFGQTQAAFVRERAIDLVAARLGADPVELRLANLVTAAEQPHQMRTPIRTDNGDYPEVLTRARAMAQRWPGPPDDGRRWGIGYCCFVQMAGVGNSTVNHLIGLSIGGYETATVRVERDGTVRLLTGVSPHGQGHETSFAQLVADRLGVAPERVELRHSDTDETPYSPYGTAASRSMAVGGAATIRAADEVADRIRRIAAELLEAAPDDIELTDWEARVRGGGGAIGLAAVATRAWQGFALPDGLAPGLQSTVVHDPPDATFSYATHVCRVAVDPETGSVEIDRYGVVHDCGVQVNPTIVEGQIHGGVAQGAGATLLEEIAYDEHGQPLTANLLTYLVPDSTFLPSIEIESIETPAPNTPGGMKGMGEGGTNGAYPCVANAVAAAVPELGDRANRTPITPEDIWRSIADDARS